MLAAVQLESLTSMAWPPVFGMWMNSSGLLTSGPCGGCGAGCSEEAAAPNKACAIAKGGFAGLVLFFREMMLIRYFSRPTAGALLARGVGLPARARLEVVLALFPRLVFLKSRHCLAPRGRDRKGYYNTSQSWAAPRPVVSRSAAAGGPLRGREAAARQ